MGRIFKRKIESTILKYFETDNAPILMIDGARQVGKSFTIRTLGMKKYENFVEINLARDREGPRLFENITSTKDLYFTIQSIAGKVLGDYNDTLIFLDEIQEYEHLFTLLKFVREEHRYKFIVSGSLLGVKLRRTSSIPVGSTSTKRMFPMDFEEFLWANGIGEDLIVEVKNGIFIDRMIPDGVHKRFMDLFKDYLISGGLPYCVDLFLEKMDVVGVRDAQMEIYDMYGNDASKYDVENKMHTKAIFDLIPSNIENKRKRLFAKDIEGKDNARFSKYKDDFDDLVDSGVVLQTICCSEPIFPLKASAKRNFLKLYMADVGILTALLYKYNVKPLRENMSQIYLGTVYECVSAMQIVANGHDLYYTDSKKLGEVDFIVDDYDTLSTIAIEIKSGKDFKSHNALNNLVTSENGPSKGLVFSNDGRIFDDGKVTYLPIYALIFF